MKFASLLLLFVLSPTVLANPLCEIVAAELAAYQIHIMLGKEMHGKSAATEEYKDKLAEAVQTYGPNLMHEVEALVAAQLGRSLQQRNADEDHRNRSRAQQTESLLRWRRSRQHPVSVPGPFIDDRTMIAANMDGQLGIYDTQTQSFGQPFDFRLNGQSRLLLSADKEFAFAIDWDGARKVELRTGKVMVFEKAIGNGGHPHDAKLSKNGVYLYIMNQDGSAYIYNADNGNFIQRLPSKFPAYGGIRESLDGRYLLFVRNFSEVTLYDMVSEKTLPLPDLRTHGGLGRVTDVDFSLDGRKILIANSNSFSIELDISDLQAPAQPSRFGFVHTLKRAYGNRYRVSFQSFGDKPIRVFDEVSGEQVYYKMAETRPGDPVEFQILGDYAFFRDDSKNWIYCLNFRTLEMDAFPLTGIAAKTFNGLRVIGPEAQSLWMETKKGTYELY